MSLPLETVNWGKHALKLLSHTKELDPNLPAIMHIRHSERFPIIPQESNEPVLTSTGEKTAYEFGKNLPLNRKYELYHTHIKRTHQTAVNIEKGIQNNKGIGQIVEKIPATCIENRDEYNKMIQERMGMFSQYETELERSRIYINRWLCGFYPPSALKPSIDLARNLALYALKNLRKAESTDVHIYVSHDQWVACLFLHWLGEISFNCVSYMDGFIIQFYEDNMLAYFRGEKKEIEYPHWWLSKY